MRRRDFVDAGKAVPGPVKGKVRICLGTEARARVRVVCDLEEGRVQDLALGDVCAVRVGIEDRLPHKSRVGDDQLLRGRRAHGLTVHVHAAVPEGFDQPGGIIGIDGDRGGRIVHAAVPHSPVIVGIDMVFRGEDRKECLVPRGLRGSVVCDLTGESFDEQDGFAGSPFPVRRAGRHSRPCTGPVYWQWRPAAALPELLVPGRQWPVRYRCSRWQEP